MVVALMVLLVLVGTVVFHFASPWWSTPIASNWGGIDDTITITFWVTGIVFIIIMAFMAYCIFRYKYQEGKRAEYEPENKKLEWWLTALTAVGVAVLLAPGLIAWGEFVTVPEDAAEVEALGQQWQWSFRYPGADGILGTTDTKNVSFDNPFGLNMDDPNGRDDVLVEAEDMHLPLDQPVKVLLRSIDVLHNFYVPEFRAKMDLIPGAVTYFWLTPTREGTFDVMCFELCGVGHYTMRSVVVVEEAGAYEAWLQEQQTFADYLENAGIGDLDRAAPILDLADADAAKRTVAE